MQTGAVDRWGDACQHLSDVDPALATVIAAHGPCTLVRRRTPGGAFGALARTVCYQQLAGAAAGAIHGRFVASYGGRPTAAAVAATPDPSLRATGLSAAKAASIKDLAERVSDGRLRLGAWNVQSDEEIVERLVTVRGIGSWTAQMFLMFELNRPDVWPVGDLGVRSGYARIHQLAGAPTATALLALGEIYRPFRTVAAWFCWRAVDQPSLRGQYRPPGRDAFPTGGRGR